MKIQILGTEWTVEIRKSGDDPKLSKNDWCGYCSGAEKLIVVCDMETCRGWEDDSTAAKLEEQRRCLRHEIVHAFLYESGLGADALSPPGAWAYNEEMVDWFARQGPKIHKAWKEVDAL